MLKMLILITFITLGYISVCSGLCSDGRPDGSGIELLGTTYGCNYLRRQYFPEERKLGIYENRKYHCKQSLTDCCETCAEILSCIDAPLNGVYLAERYFNCSYLLRYYPEDRHVGIYKDRKFICQQTTTDCCESCENVMDEIGPPSNVTTKASVTTTPASSKPPASTQQPVEYEDTCGDNCLWIADGTSGKCSWLLDPSRPVYDSRHMFCKKGLALGCKRTCHIISQEREPEGTNTTKQSPRPVCEDSYIMVEKISYRCRDLLNPASSIYNNRLALCGTNRKACCISCGQVKNKKPSAVIKHNKQNMIEKPGYNSVVLPVDKISATSINTNDINSNDDTHRLESVHNTAKVSNPSVEMPYQTGLQAFFESMKANAERMRKAEETRRNAFSQMVGTLLSMFNNMQPKRK